jgi:hypothetical protein
MSQCIPSTAIIIIKMGRGKEGRWPKQCIHVSKGKDNKIKKDNNSNKNK